MVGNSFIKPEEVIKEFSDIINENTKHMDKETKSLFIKQLMYNMQTALGGFPDDTNTSTGS